MVIATASLLPERRVVRRHDELDLLAAAMQFLDLALPPDAIAHHSPGEGKRTLRAQRDLKRSGYKAGWPDIEVIYRGRSHFIELKAAHGSLSTAQRHMHRRLNYCGAAVMLCRTLDDVEAQLREACVPLKATAMNGGL